MPTLAQRLLQYEDLDTYDLSSLKKMHSAGGAAFPELVREVFGRLNMRFHNGYGATEGMTPSPRAEDDIETVCSHRGPADLPAATSTRWSTSTATRCRPTRQGELLVKGPSVFTGYYMNPEENAKVFDADGFFKTGDVAVIDEKGYVTITGRLKEMINRGGESISATVIESLINRHPDVAVGGGRRHARPADGRAGLRLRPAEGRRAR